MSPRLQTLTKRRWAPILCLSAAASLLLAAGCASTAASRDVSRAPEGRDAGRAPAPFAEAFTPEQARRIGAVQPHVREAAAEYELDPHLINAVIWVESRFVPDAKSPAGARGLMQLMPATAAGLAKQLGERRPRSYDPAFNVRAGSYYLRRLIDRFDGDLELALASYNAGAGNVGKWMASGEGLPDHSRDYVAKVLAARARFVGTQVPDPVLVPSPPAMPEAPMLAEGSERGDANVADAADANEATDEAGGSERELPTATPSVALHANGPVEDYEPVFEPHPELDAHPTPPEPAEPTPTEPAPVEPTVQKPPTVGQGILPGVAD